MNEIYRDFVFLEYEQQGNKRWEMSQTTSFSDASRAPKELNSYIYFNPDYM